ncbi:uncharacterized protein LOC110722934 [Chenopodium quinoa]|uniref:uncharacterized protein LOC110722934 n=1 Tax=Chenopodium quinoa TaxID=63459 RepID=UPI000B7877D3|nr:uncharacterized protein LOC110722934 [Chenopodium quinoa]
MKLNPKKCVFGVRSGKFLGFMVSERGIDANPDKVNAVLEMKQPKTIRDMQRITGRMVGLTRFISKSAASPKTIAAVLAVERKKQQMPIYFVSHVLNAIERRYPIIEKMELAVVVAGEIDVLMNYPLEKSFHKMDTSGRLLKWAVKLSEYEIHYKPRVSIKAHALSDFIVEASYTDEEEDIGTWQVTNNEAEYEAALVGIQLSIAAEEKRLVLTTDSQLVSSQYKGEYETREQSMVKYLEKINQLTAQLQYFEIKLVPRAQNAQADALARLASSSFNNLERTVMVEILGEKSIDEAPEQVLCVDSATQWYDNKLAYLVHGVLPADKGESQKLRKDSVWFIMHQGKLYKRSFSYY